MSSEYDGTTGYKGENVAGDKLDKTVLWHASSNPGAGSNDVPANGLLLNTTDKKIYENTGTKASPTWTERMKEPTSLRTLEEEATISNTDTSYTFTAGTAIDLKNDVEKVVVVAQLETNGSGSLELDINSLSDYQTAKTENVNGTATDSSQDGTINTIELASTSVIGGASALLLILELYYFKIGSDDMIGGRWTIAAAVDEIRGTFNIRASEADQVGELDTLTLSLGASSFSAGKVRVISEAQVT